jgi:hypothetical protein
MLSDPGPGVGFTFNQIYTDRPICSKLHKKSVADWGPHAIIGGSSELETSPFPFFKIFRKSLLAGTLLELSLQWQPFYPHAMWFSRNNLLVLPFDIPISMSILTGTAVVATVALRGQAIWTGLTFLISRMANVLYPIVPGDPSPARLMATLYSDNFLRCYLIKHVKHATNLPSRPYISPTVKGILKSFYVDARTISSGNPSMAAFIVCDLG